jgi:hypothetical protein
MAEEPPYLSTIMVVVHLQRLVFMRRLADQATTALLSEHPSQLLLSQSVLLEDPRGSLDLSESLRVLLMELP